MKKTLLALSLLAAFGGSRIARADDDLGAALAQENPEGGGSIRAKKEPDLAAQQRKADKKNVQARVIAVKRGAFPNVALVLKVTKVAEDGPNKDKAKKDEQLIVSPMYKTVAGAPSGQPAGTPDWKDAATVMNAGAFYLTESDNVYVRLESLDGKIWKVGYIERR